jgi:hypothetical protein
MLSFWQTSEQLNSAEALKGAGGELGKFFHMTLNGTFGSLIEIIIVLVCLLLLSLSLQVYIGTDNGVCRVSNQKDGEKESLGIGGLFSESKSIMERMIRETRILQFQ